MSYNATSPICNLKVLVQSDSNLDNMANVTGTSGITGANFDIYGANRVLPRAMTAFTAIAWYNSIELLILVFVIFRRYSGLYFWGLIVNAISIVPYATGMISLPN